MNLGKHSWLERDSSAPLGLWEAALSVTSFPNWLSQYPLPSIHAIFPSPVTCDLRFHIPHPQRIRLWSGQVLLIAWSGGSTGWGVQAGFHSPGGLLTAWPWASSCSLPSFLVCRLRGLSCIHSFHFSLSKYLFSSYSVLDTEDGTGKRTNKVLAPWSVRNSRRKRRESKRQQRLNILVNSNDLWRFY